jgi:sulfite reductase (ferredoxin)
MNDTTLARARQAHLDKLEEATRRFLDRTITAAQYRAVRVPAGIYEQRENGRYMIRVRCPAGVVTAQQLRVLAAAAERFAAPVLHLTTRQDIQLHDVAVGQIIPAVRMLAAAGLSSLGGGGNTVRNVTVCPLAGFCPLEEVDVTPHALLLTSALLSTSGGTDLPRKFKIALSGCGQDCAGARFADVGLIAASGKAPGAGQGAAPGPRTFLMYAGGGLGARSRPAFLLEESLPEVELVPAAQAVRDVFDRMGNRRNRHQARLRFLVEQLGQDAFANHYRQARSRSGGAAPALEAAPAWTRSQDVTAAADGRAEAPQQPGTAAQVPGSADLLRWVELNASGQRQAGFFYLTLPSFLGEVSAGSLRTVAEAVERFGVGIARVVQTQNLVVPGVPGTSLSQAYDLLRGTGLAEPLPRILRDMTVCAGASTCRLGICRSRGLAQALRERLEASQLHLDALAGVAVHVSGCPNSCGRHPLADVGLAGAARRVHDRLVPHYQLQLGTGVPGTLAEPGPLLPARRVAEAVESLLAGLAEARAKDPASPALGMKELLDGFSQACDCADLQVDWGETTDFSLAGRGPGECGAGVFDLIELDLAAADQALGQGKLTEAAVAAARALLVTRGLSATSDLDALRLFRDHMVGPDLIAAEHLGILEQSLDALGKPAGARAACDRDGVSALLAAVKDLYGRLDDSLRLPVSEPVRPAAVPAPSEVRTEDLRGVTCPLNFVRARSALSRAPMGGEMAFLLDAPGARNVPQSLAKDGQEVLSLSQDESGWRLRIRRLR